MFFHESRIDVAVMILNMLYHMYKQQYDSVKATCNASDLTICLGHFTTILATVGPQQE